MLVTFLISCVSGANIDISVGRGLRFNPSDVDVNVGDTIIWTFDASHSVSEGLACIPSGFDSGVMNTGTFKYIVPQERLNTTINYFCKVQSHCLQGMTGNINVKSGTVTMTPTPPKNDANAIKTSFNYLSILISLII